MVSLSSDPGLRVRSFLCIGGKKSPARSDLDRADTFVVGTHSRCMEHLTACPEAAGPNPARPPSGALALSSRASPRWRSGVRRDPGLPGPVHRHPLRQRRGEPDGERGADAGLLPRPHCGQRPGRLACPGVPERHRGALDDALQPDESCGRRALRHAPLRPAPGQHRRGVASPPAASAARSYTSRAGAGTSRRFCGSTEKPRISRAVAPRSGRSPFSAKATGTGAFRPATSISRYPTGRWTVVPSAISNSRTKAGGTPSDSRRDRGSFVNVAPVSTKTSISWPLASRAFAVNVPTAKSRVLTRKSLSAPFRGNRAHDPHAIIVPPRPLTSRS